MTRHFRCEEQKRSNGVRWKVFCRLAIHIAMTGGRALIAMMVFAMAGCERAQLLAPTSSTITLTAPTKVLPTGGSTDLTVFVAELTGTPVLNGTMVRFTASLGTVTPVEVETRNGLAVTRFTAGNSPGIAEIRATSGATGTVSSGSTATNVVQISIGAAAVSTVTLRATPGSVGPGGGSVELIALVLGEQGAAVGDVVVTFTADQGTLSSRSVITNGDGEARTTLTTSQQTIVSATTGTKSSGNLTVTVRSGPIVSVSCSPAGSTGSCSPVQASSSNNTATVVFTITRASGSSTLQSSTIDFGDNSSESLGPLSSGTATSTHIYNGPSDSTPKSYTATVRATDINGEITSTSLSVLVTPRQVLGVSLTASPGTSVADVGNTTSFTATVTPTTGGADVVESYSWDFGDDSTATTTSNTTTHVYTTNGRKTATVTVKTTDGRSVTGRVEFIISGI